MVTIRFTHLERTALNATTITNYLPISNHPLSANNQIYPKIKIYLPQITQPILKPAHQQLDVAKVFLALPDYKHQFDYYPSVTITELTS